MSYEFPTIRTIDDVLPHIKGCEEFIVAERDGFTVVNYMVSGPDTFPPLKVSGGSKRMREERMLGNRIRRECRGLIFYPDGRIMSRPFHKFFNIGEREETQLHSIDWTRPHVIIEKMDGSMIRPLDVNGTLRLGTKMGVTDVSEQAEEIMTDGQRGWMDIMMKQHVTPLFEFVSPENRIVVEYDKAELVLLAMRNNITGEYLDVELMRNNEFFRVVDTYGAVGGDFAEFLEEQRGLEGREGFIISFAGDMYKGKNDWYVLIHKTKDQIRFDRNIVDLILNKGLDDVLPMLSEIDSDRVRDFEGHFWNNFWNKENHVKSLHAKAVKFGDRKAIATQFMSTVSNKGDAALVYRMLDGNDCRESLLAHIEKNISSNVKWDQCAEWLEMDNNGKDV
jgi:RNA ligase